MIFKLQIRSFNTSHNYQNIIKPALQLYGLNGRYAHALYSAAYKEKKLEVVEKELKSISEKLLADHKFSSIVNNPLIARKPKRSVLIENGRYNKIPSILKSYERIMESHRGEVAAEVVTAKPLDKEMLKEVENALQALIMKSETLKLTTKIDPGIIGGMIVRVGDKHVDMSMATKLNLYKNSILHPV